MRYTVVVVFSFLVLSVVGLPLHADTAEELLAAAQAALNKGQADEALKLANRAIKMEPKNPQTHFFRGVLREALENHSEAVADFTTVLKLDPKFAEALNRRGSELFKLGKIKESIADFDRYLELKPQESAGHWKRGISYYYAGRFEDGRKQFEGYEKVDTNDVENAVWHYLCTARAAGVEKARAALLKIGKDKRVPMMEVYDLFAGKAKPAGVLAAARAGKPSKELLNRQLFYAHLYLGLYYETLNDKKQALEHLQKAANDHRIRHYMWDVARVHRDVLEKEMKK
jgi:lipoprotein NlpI